MSEEKKSEQDLTVSVQDIDNIEKFLDHFKFTRSKEFIAAVEAFKKDGNRKHALEAIHEVAKTMKAAKGQNELIDDLFVDIFPACDSISYNMQFDKDLEDIIGVDPATKTDQA